ncbi:hypothetical protein MHBO_003500 [Bonamia ostreae]|uniref:Uncharacterized protein n=1 Tax=Bonamia ostreae TaxID=126728 RepID=A0ABV2AQM3_9EUKA
MILFSIINFVLTTGATLILLVLIFNPNWLVAVANNNSFHLGIRGYSTSTAKFDLSGISSYGKNSPFCIGACPKFEEGNKILLALMSIMIFALVALAIIKGLLLCFSKILKYLFIILYACLAISSVVLPILYDLYFKKSINKSFNVSNSFNLYLSLALVPIFIVLAVLAKF